MKATQMLHDLGQSLWLDNITRDLLTSGTLKRYIDELSVTGLTSNPDDLRPRDQEQQRLRRRHPQEAQGGQVGRGAVLRAGAGGSRLRPPTCSDPSTTGPTAWTAGYRWKFRRCWPTTRPALSPQPRNCTRRAGRPNLFIKIPGTKEGLPAIEEAIFAGVPINVTLLFSREQYLAAAEAYLRGIERRIDAGLKPDVGSVASLFISRWDVAVAGKVPDALRDQLGIAIAKRTYKAYRELLGSPRWQRVYNSGARPQRLLWASTGTKDPKASDVLYVKALAAPFTVNTMPEGTLKALADHGEISEIMSADGGDCEAVLGQFAKAGIDVDALAKQLQEEGAKSFVSSWNELMGVIASKSAAMQKAS